MAATFLTGLGTFAITAAAHADVPGPTPPARVGNSTCIGELHLKVTHFTGEPASARGSITFPSCTVAGRPDITHAIAKIIGSATGNPDDVTIHEMNTMTWLNAAGKPVATRKLAIVRTLLGPDPDNMLTVARGAKTNQFAGVLGAAASASFNINAGRAQRHPAEGGAWWYTNQSAGDDGDAAVAVCDAMPEATPEQQQRKLECYEAASGG
ncbi:hypothetical protein GCM10023191_055410 [Actinoallomurus oryzae]|uniref:DUF3558 domain-containing protein n=1 Tax=Actinoallomurus oryzae TaxID=502180 RepID=A0ABP8QJQ6_9ACTN